MKGAPKALVPLLAPIGFFLLALALYTFRLDRESLSLDEATSYLVSREWGVLVDIFLYKDRNMWLYYLTLFTFLRFGDTEFWIRLPSAIAGAAGVAGMYYLGTQLGGIRAGVLAAVLLLLNPFYSFYAQDARSYPLFAALTIVSHILLERYRKQPSRRRLLAYWIAALSSIYAHIFAVLPIAVQLVFIAFTSRGTLSRRLLRVVRLTAGFMAGILPLAVTLIASSYQEIAAGTKTVLDWVQPPQLSELGKLYFSFAGGSIAVTVLLTVFTLLALRRCHKPELRMHAALLFGTIPLVFLFSLAVKPVFVPRYMIYALPSAMLLAALGVCQLTRRVGLAAGAVLVLLVANTLRISYTTPAKPPFRTVAAELTELRVAGDSVVFFPEQLEKPVEYYTQRYAGPRSTATRAPGVWFITRIDHPPKRRATADQIRKKLATDSILYRDQTYGPLRVSVYVKRE
ncbi:MAG: glycosyltransferase family 39 protein [Patescibacteria group bacterium]|nr:glycosyltransferase family 39 protein [Patescibacteria group bacterium]